jgi:hypothetical protein
VRGQSKKVQTFNEKLFPKNFNREGVLERHNFFGKLAYVHVEHDLRRQR